jgi:iron(III) transport system permease protein
LVRPADSLWPFGWLDQLGEPDARRPDPGGAHGRWWLWPICHRASACGAAGRHRPAPPRRRQRAIVAGGLGLHVVLPSGLRRRPQRLELGWLEALFGPVAPQPGMGYGALVTVSALLILMTTGLAGRGVHARRRAFVVSSIGVVVVSIAIFVFFPVDHDPRSGRSGADGGPSLAALSRASRRRRSGAPAASPACRAAAYSGTRWCLRSPAC